MDVYGNYDEFEMFDLFIESLREAPHDGAAVLDMKRVQDMKIAFGILKQALSEDCNVSIKCGQIKIAPDMGEITIEGATIGFQDTEAFMLASHLANNAEVYPLIKNKVRMSFGFIITQIIK